jgi:hypothetical protein
VLADLSPDQRRLADYMSELSELAYCAGWMKGLEFALWEVVQGRRTRYGQTVFTQAQRQELASLAERIGGWIVFYDQQEESFLPLEDWKHAFEKGNSEQA